MLFKIMVTIIIIIANNKIYMSFLSNHWIFWKSLVYALLTKFKEFASVGWGWKTRLSKWWWPLVGFDYVISLNHSYIYRQYITHIASHFPWRYIATKKSRHLRHFEYIAIYWMCRDILDIYRDILENIALLKKAWNLRNKSMVLAVLLKLNILNS